jgi:peptidyl-Lys metalloendopeptidase
MKNRWINLSICFILLFSLGFSVVSVGAAAKDSPLVTLSSSQSEFSETEDVVITATFSNPSNHSMRILKWFTPSEGIQEPIFEVVLNGSPVEYLGAYYKRPAPTGNDYISLKSGESVSFEVNLAEYYDLSVTGDYEVVYKAQSSNLFTEKSNNGSSTTTLSSQPISLKVDGRTKPVTPTATPAPTTGTGFNACTTTQQSQLLTARQEALNYATSASSYLSGINSGTARYLTWFGSYTNTRFSLVTDHFNSLSSAWANAYVTFDCKCRQNYYAYVYPTKPYTIYVCKVFWTAPMTGTDSKAGTLIHEMSHFNVVASTDDYVYGQTGAMNLALTNPDQAVDNADNHEYFAENNPFNP